MRKGWFGESHRHSLARRGIKTRRKKIIRRRRIRKKFSVLKRKPRVFVSFHTKDRHAKELLVAQAKNKNINLQFSDQSVNRPFSSKWKTRTKKRIQRASTTVVMVGRDTYRRKAVNWEIEQSRKTGNKVLAVQIHRDKHHRLPSSIKKREEIRWHVNTLSRKIRRRK